MPGGTAEAGRFLYFETPLGENKMLLKSFSGEESISNLFRFRLNVKTDIATSFTWDQLLAQKVNFGIRPLGSAKERHFHGVVSEITEIDRDKNFRYYTLEVVPQLWFLTQVHRSRIFQHKTVPDILQLVLTGLDVVYQIQGTFEQREYCTQYQETDFNFISRLMEEEGIYYFFKFTRGNHQMVVANTPTSHPPTPEISTIKFERDYGETRDDERIFTFEKTQRARTVKYTLWDHHFQLAHRHLETTKPIKETVQVGTVNHKLKLLPDTAENYENTGRYAQRFDGVDKGGANKPDDLQKIFTDNNRTRDIRIQEAESQLVLIHGTSDQRQMTSGHKFTLADHPDANGSYVITAVTHTGAEGSFRSGETQPGVSYSNSFLAIPYASPFRPPRRTVRPKMDGSQTAVVVGPPGEEIFTDKYGRVKVQFHWDREGQNNADSSCWVRVSTPAAGPNYGFILIPRIGWEVVVTYIEGDIDRPLITGCVYSSMTMPPYDLDTNRPDMKTVWALKSRSSQGNDPTKFNEIRFQDKTGHEQIFVHAEKDFDIHVKNHLRKNIEAEEHIIVKTNQTVQVGGDISHETGGNVTEHVGGNTYRTVGGNQTDETAGNVSIDIGGNKEAAIGGNVDEAIGGNYNDSVGGNRGSQVGGTWITNVGGRAALISGGNIHIQGQTIVLEATQITLKGGSGTVVVDPSGVSVDGPMVKLNTPGAVPGMGMGDMGRQNATKYNKKGKKTIKSHRADNGTKFTKTGEGPSS
jgi:type VI secretion system secreted protein VgrG